MVQLMIMMLERVGIIVILGFMLAHMKVFRQHLQHPEGYKGKGVLIFIFSLFSIISNYTGIEIREREILNNDWIFAIDPSSSIANTRILGVEIGGNLHRLFRLSETAGAESGAQVRDPPPPPESRFLDGPGQRVSAAAHPAPAVPAVPAAPEKGFLSS